MHVKRCNGNYKTSRKNEYGYNTLSIIGIQKKSDLGARCGVNIGVFYPRLGCLGLEKITSLLFLCLTGPLLR